jgi:hypothetical protein
MTAVRSLSRAGSSAAGAGPAQRIPSVNMRAETLADAIKMLLLESSD